MAWGDLTPKQYVSMAEVDTSPFNKHVAITPSARFMTKGEAIMHLDILHSNLNLLTDVQWVWKELLASGRTKAWRPIYPFCVQGSTPIKSVGDHFGGGIVAYILTQYDTGYDANLQHGIIAAPYDQSTGIAWWNGTYTNTGTTSTARGDGQANTNLIIASQGNYGSYAAKLCADLSLAGYTDWYLPTLNESSELRINKAIIGNFSTGEYHNSTEMDIDVTDVLHFLDESLHGVGKEYPAYVRAVRSFQMYLINTGYKGYSTLEEYWTDDNTATGTTKANTLGQADYVAPVYDTTSCAIPDITPPTKPTTISLIEATSSSLQIGWSGASDDRGVNQYHITIPGVGNYETAENFITIGGLLSWTSYELQVWSVDAAGNVSETYADIIAETLMDVNNTISVNPYYQVAYSGGGEVYFDVASNYNQLDFASNSEWCMVGADSYSNNATITATAEANYDANSREAVISVYHNGVVIANVYVEQDPYY